jgi:hypothetical protein
MKEKDSDKQTCSACAEDLGQTGVVPECASCPMDQGDDIIPVEVKIPTPKGSSDTPSGEMRACLDPNGPNGLK